MEEGVEKGKNSSSVISSKCHDRPKLDQMNIFHFYF